MHIYRRKKCSRTESDPSLIKGRLKVLTKKKTLKVKTNQRYVILSSVLISTRSIQSRFYYDKNVNDRVECGNK